MQTTLRIDDDLHRRAKMEAARRGVTLTQLIEEGLRMQLEVASRPPVVLPTFDSGLSFNFTPEEIRALMNDDSEQLARLGLTPEVVSPRK